MRSGMILRRFEQPDEVRVFPRMRAGDLFYFPPGPPGHDNWVVGDEPCVSLHFMGADDYGAKGDGEA